MTDKVVKAKCFFENKEHFDKNYKFTGAYCSAKSNDDSCPFGSGFYDKVGCCGNCSHCCITLSPK